MRLVSYALLALAVLLTGPIEVRAETLLLVDGILGDVVQSTFNGMQDQWIKTGRGQARILRPSSFASWDENAEEIASELSAELEQSSEHDNHPHPGVVLMAHSRGAAELLLTLLKNPTLLKHPALKKVILIQGAFYGSPLADWVNNKASSWPIGDELLTPLKPALLSLTQPEARARMARATGECPEDMRPLFMQKVAFVRASQTLEKTRTMLMPGSLYLKLFFGAETDGILLTEEQIVPGFGQDWGVLQGDHFTWVETGARSAQLLQRVVTALQTAL